ncbi:MAG: ACP S-malonyltransferase [Actinobacteria bacterium]|nr:ACP S-malonyltransferase [Actinomycetota bacterium]
MGLPWRDHPAWSVVERAEALLGEPLAPLLLDAPTAALASTRAAQLAVLCTSLVTWEALRNRIEPVGFAGHSLGQVTALIASGTLSFDDGLRFASRRAACTQAAADAHPGRMAALLGATLDQAQEACAAAPDACWVANDNAPGQVVLAGTPKGLDVALARAKVVGVPRATMLNVGGAFHTPLMRDAVDELRACLSVVELVTPRAPVVSNDDGAAYADAEGWRARSADHVAVPVRWRLVQSTLTGLGTDTFLEVGHGSMLATLAKRTVPEVNVHGVATPEAVEGIA